MTEVWGQSKVSDTATLKEFCRDTMQLSDRLFDQFGTFASALDSATSAKYENVESETKGSKAGHRLLAHPGNTIDSMVKWLRLRDPYLASTSVRLTEKILNRMSEVGLKVADAPSKFLEQVIRGDPRGRTHLTVAEKAELARATERNLGRPIIVPDIEPQPSDSSRASSVALSRGAAGKKSAAIDLDAWKAKAKASLRDGNAVDVDEFDDSYLADEDILAHTKHLDLKAQQAQQAHQDSIAGSFKGARALGSRPAPSLLKGGKTRPQSDAERAVFREKREKEREAKKKRDAEALAKIKKKIPTKSSAVPGEGHELGNIGIKGKDHTPKGPSIMVSSDSDSDSDDEIDETVFGASAKQPKLSDSARENQSGKMQPKHQQGPVKKMRQARSAKDMRARLAPDLVSLHQTILGWDFFHDGDFPPGSTRNDYSFVSERFRTPLEYQNTFEPLLLLEAWQGFLKSKEEGNLKSFEIKIANRMTIDSFIEVSTAMPIHEGQELGISEADIILLSKASSPVAESQEPRCLARINRITRKKGMMEINYRLVPGNSLVSLIVPNATIHGTKVMSITPLEREYGALLGLKYYDLCDEITKAKPSPLLKYREEQVSPLVTNYKVNVAQARAIRSAIDNDAFTLIQGPPGSGKTKTIVAIVGALLSTSFSDRGVTIQRPSGAEATSRQAPPLAKKLLVCAPSNAAVDELVMRFKNGIKTVNGVAQKISVVRLGRSDAINSNVLDVTLDELVNAKLNLASEKKSSAGGDVHQLKQTHKDVCDKLNALRNELDKNKGQGQAVSPEQEHEVEVLKRKKQQLGNKIDQARDNGDMIARDVEINRRQIQQGILDGAHVLCATLSGSGHEMFQNLNIEFETVIIDEAAQSIELSALIPLKYGCSKCILVGDPKQLPPTVLSREAARFQYEQSLFVRMQSNHPEDVHLLDTQYRMHPEISRFPSTAFYEGRLLDGESMLSLRTKPWHKSPLLSPYRFFDVIGAHQSAPRGHSLINLAEIEIALRLFDRLTTDCKGYDFKNNIGIITPYRSQLRELKARFAQEYGRNILERVEFNTTDAFQGRESEVIIFSCVRASTSKGVGFLSDIRRMNVGITRAKSSLWVLGNSQSLMKGEFWSKLIEDARNRDRFTNGDLVGMLQHPLAELASNGPHNLTHPIESGEASDVEMIDAPEHLDSTGDKSRTSSITREQNALYQPSGGANGLNPLGNCGRCGSASHPAHLCDNAFVKEMGQGACYRCGDSDHRKHECTADRCLECGEIGHPSRFCFSAKTLSKDEKKQLAKAEDAHKRYMSTFTDRMRQKQLGEHAKQVPDVKSTRKTPPPVQVHQGQAHQSLPRKPLEKPPLNSEAKDPLSQSLPLVNGLSSSRQSTHTDLTPAQYRSQQDTDRSRQVPQQSHRQGAPKPHEVPQIDALRADRKMKAEMEGSNSITQSSDISHDRSTPVNKPVPLQSQVKPPIRKRKEADPFLRPKDKKVRR